MEEKEGEEEKEKNSKSSSSTSHVSKEVTSRNFEETSP